MIVEMALVRVQEVKVILVDKVLMRALETKIKVLVKMLRRVMVMMKMMEMKTNMVEVLVRVKMEKVYVRVIGIQ